MKNNPWLISIIVFLSGALIGAGGYLAYKRQKINKIDSFESCRAAGYPVAESYPEQCFVSGGRSFTRDLPKDGVACTMEVKICPDGSAVGRTLPDCEFEKCPNN